MRNILVHDYDGVNIGRVGTLQLKISLFCRQIPAAPCAAEVPPSGKQTGDSFSAPERGIFYRPKPCVSELRRLAFESLPARGFQAANRQGSGRRR